MKLNYSELQDTSTSFGGRKNHGLCEVYANDARDIVLNMLRKLASFTLILSSVEGRGGGGPSPQGEGPPGGPHPRVKAPLFLQMRGWLRSYCWLGGGRPISW